jgi:hypothetical protein
MTVLDQVRGLIERLPPAPICSKNKIAIRKR